MIALFLNKGMRHIFLCVSETIDDARYECHRLARIGKAPGMRGAWSRHCGGSSEFFLYGSGGYDFIEVDELKSRKRCDGKIFWSKSIYNDDIFHEVGFHSFLPPPKSLQEMMVQFVPKEGESRLEDKLREYAMDRRMREETGERYRPLKAIFEQRHCKDVNT